MTISVNSTSTTETPLTNRDSRLFVCRLEQIFLLPVLSFLFCFSLTSCDQPPRKTHLTIAISQIVEHPALDEVRDGIEATLKKGLQNRKYEILYRNAQGNITTAKQIAQNLIDQTPHILVAISTPSAQTLKSSLKGKNIPLVFAGVTDPLQAGLTKDLEIPSKGITGVVDTPLLGQQLDMMRAIMPHLKTLGVMYNPGEPNSVATIQRLKKLCEEKGLIVVEGTVTKSSDVASTAQYLMPKVQAVYVPQDNILVATMKTLARVSYALKTPIFASDTGSVENGALATISYSYYDIGVEAGKKILKILNGAPPESLPIRPPQGAKFYKNTNAAKLLDVQIPDEL